MPGEFQRLIQQIRQERAIGQSGQHVMPDPPLQGLQQLTFFADIETNRQVSINAPRGVIKHRHHGAFDPIQASILCAITDLALPDIAQGDGAPHGGEEIGAMQAGIQQTMVLPQQFLTTVAGHGAELIVDIGNPAVQIGLGKNRGGIHGPAVFLIHESGSLSLAVVPLDQRRMPGRDVLRRTAQRHVITP